MVLCYLGDLVIVFMMLELTEGNDEIPLLSGKQLKVAIAEVLFVYFFSIKLYRNTRNKGY